MGFELLLSPASGKAVLDQIGDHTDQAIVCFGDRATTLEEAYASFSRNLLEAMGSEGEREHFQPFAFGAVK